MIWYTNVFVVSILCWMTMSIVMISGDSSSVDYSNLVNELRGEDRRLFNYDASEHTKNKQLDDSICGKAIMDEAMKIIVENNTSSGSHGNMSIGKALEYITLCVTDNPSKRSDFASYPGIHDAILTILDQQYSILKTEPNDITTYTLAMAAHVMYITSYANVVNHQAYITKGGVSKLMNIIKGTVHKYVEGDDEGFEIKYPTVTMWSNAALSNLAASYCDTENDGKCYYYWTETGLQLDNESLPVISDGSSAREMIVQDADIMKLLTELSCQGPVSTDDNYDVVMAGVNAEIYRDESSWTIIPWSAASALKNIALNPLAHPYIENSIECFCFLQQSTDWLEQEKGERVLRHVRRGNPCYFSLIFDDNEEFVERRLCVDRIFHHADGYTCTDYGDEPSEEDCNAVDRNDVAATKACCSCEGGDFYIAPSYQGGYDEPDEEEATEEGGEAATEGGEAGEEAIAAEL